MESQDRFLILDEQLRGLDARRRIMEAMLWVPRSILVTLLAAGLIAILMRLFPLVDNHTFAVVVGVSTVCGLMASLVVIFMRRRSLISQARFADEKLALFERASTAVEINAGKIVASTSLRELQLDDTLEAFAKVARMQAMPLQWRWREIAILMMVLILLIISIVVPNPQIDVLEQQIAVAQAIEAQVEVLEEIEQAINQTDLLDPGLQDLLKEPIQSAVETLRSGDLNREQAVAVLSETEADLRDLADELGNEALNQALEPVGRPLLDNPAGQQLGDALISADLFGVSEATNQMADSLPTLNEEDRTILAQDLAEMAASLQMVDSKLAAELSEAAQALQSGDIAAAQSGLREAAAILQDRAQEVEAANMAADVAIQIDEGSREVAQAGQTDPTGGQDGSQASAWSNSTQDSTGGDGQSQGPDPGPTSEQGQGPGGVGPGGGRAESVFVPDPFEFDLDEGIDVELPADCAGNLAGCGALLNESATEFGDEKSLVPYQQVFMEYRNSAFEALEGDYIPLGMKSYIRDYFTQLEP